MKREIKRKEKYNLRQILQVVKDIYQCESHEDSWGVKVVYKETFIGSLKSRLKEIKYYIN